MDQAYLNALRVRLGCRVVAVAGALARHGGIEYGKAMQANRHRVCHAVDFCGGMQTGALAIGLSRRCNIVRGFFLLVLGICWFGVRGGPTHCVARNRR